MRAVRIEPSPELVHRCGWALARTLRYRERGFEHVRAAVAASPTRSVIFCLFHQSLFTLLGRHHHQRVAALTSLSRDGTIMAGFLERIGMRPIRGSSSRGGLRAARELIDAIAEGWHGAVTVDGPRGPYKEVKPGPFEIARRTGAPLLPIGVRAGRELIFKRAWDRFRLPLPRAPMALVYGEAIWCPPEYPSPDEILARRRELGRRLLDLDAQASAMVGKRDSAPPRASLRWLADDAAASVRGDA